MLLYVVDTYVEEACPFISGSRVYSSYDTLYEHKSQHHCLQQFNAYTVNRYKRR